MLIHFFLLNDNYQGVEHKDNTDKPTLLYNNRNNRSSQKKIDLGTVVLLNKYSTIDLFCNLDLVEDI